MLVASLVPQERKSIEKPDFTGAPHLRAIQQRGYLRVGVSPDMPPFSWNDPSTGEMRGLEIDLAKCLGQALFGCDPRQVRSHLEFVDTYFPQRPWILDQRHVDIVICAYADNAGRRKQTLFAGHYMAGKPAVLLSSRCPDIGGLGDLNGLRVTMLSGSSGLNKLLSGAPMAEPLLFDTVTECLKALRSGAAEALWATTAENLPYGQGTADGFRQAIFKSTVEPWGIGVHQSAVDIGRFVSDSMAELVANGTLAHLMRRWLPGLDT